MAGNSQPPDIPTLPMGVRPDEAEAVKAAFSTVKVPTVATPAETPPADSVQTAGPVSWPSVPGYRILDLVGKGGMGVVYKAEQVGLKRVVALKMILHGEHSNDEIRSRFRREAEALAQIKHEHIVEVYDTGECNGTPFYSMEYVEGGSLNDYLNGEPLPPKFAAKLVETLSRAVHAAHQAGVIHRDLKPANILLAFAGTSGDSRPSEPSAVDWQDANFVPKLTDFGLAKKEGDSVHTQPGTVLGTPNYMAPEQSLASREKITPATDVYALGAVLYQLLSGHPPFKPASPTDAVLRALTNAPRKLRKAKIPLPRALEAICLKCLQLNPALRYASAQALAEDLERWLQGEPTLAQPPSWPTRLWRWPRKHPRVSAAVALVASLAMATGATLYFIDPQRQLENIEIRIRNGGAVTLIGETGGPKWSSWATGGARSQMSLTADGIYSVHSWSLGLLELVHTAPPSYTLRAEVKHDICSAPGDVGIYCALKEYPTDQGLLQFYTLVSFNDIIDAPKPPKGFEHTFRPEALALLQGNPVMVKPSLSLKSEFETSPYSNSGIFNLRFTPAGYRGGVWRKMLIHVSPEGVDAYWDGQHAGTLNSTKLNQMGKKTMARFQERANPFIGQQAQPVFDSSGSVGVCVYRGSASFRNVIIEMRHNN
jgi:eukaryotic-like serine/threonine-protein kinase